MAKKMIFIAAACLLLLAGSANHLPSITAQSITVQVTGDVVNIRSGPGTSHSIMAQGRQGDTYTVLESKGDWYQVSLPQGGKGWIASWLVEKQAASLRSSKGTIHADRLNVRKTPDLSAAVIGKLNSGDSVSIIKETNGWTEIAYGAGTAWISSEFVTATAASKTKMDEQAQEKSITILHDGTNIRKKASLSSSIIATAKAGESYNIKGREGDWYEIGISGGKTGYVAGWVVTSTSNKTNAASTSKGIAGKTIIIDPGHGGRDQGTTGASGTLEKDVTLSTAELLADKLRSAGANVILTRSADQYITLPDRTGLAMRKSADAFVSLHYDSADDRGTSGHTTYYYYYYEKALAEAIHSRLAAGEATRDRGVRYGDYFVLRENSQPAVLLELGYLSNHSEESVIRSQKFRDRAASAIADGLADYFGR